MKFKTVLWCFLVATTVSIAQGKKSKGDFLFYEYQYKGAITAYEKELSKKKLTGQQYLNLADSYLKVGNFKRASKIYLDIYELEVSKKDSAGIMSNHRFNKLLQSLSGISEKEKIDKLLKVRKTFSSPELMENANFNSELLASNAASELKFEIFNLEVNSPQSDFSPSFYNDKILFTSGRPQKSRKVYEPSGESYLDIFVAKVRPEGNAINANSFTGIPSSDFHRATPFYSKELNNIFYMLSNTKKGKLAFNDKGKNALAIGKTNGVGDFSFLLKDLSVSFYYPFYNVATSKLYFAADFEDSYGGTDIYYVHTNQGQIMSAPINLGPTINTPGNEIAPYVFENSLYFSSDIFYGLGGMDIYKSNLREDNTFSIPVNLGNGINSTYDDFGFIIKNNDNNGLIGYFSSNREGGKGNDDIYGYTVAEKPGIKTILIEGSVVNTFNNKGVSKALVEVFDASGKRVKEIYTKDDGFYQFEIPWEDAINIKVTKERYSNFSELYVKEEIEELQKGTLDVKVSLLDDLVEEREGQTVIKLNKFYFRKGRSEITSYIAKEIDNVIDVIKKFPQLQLRIESHTDSRLGGSTNFRISQKRSDAIKKYLIDNGVPTSNILYSVGYGEDNLVNKCKNGVFCLDIQHKENERSLIVVLNYNVLY